MRVGPPAFMPAMSAGTTVKIDDDNAALTYTQVGSPLAGKYSFGGLYELITRQEPEVLD